MNASESSSGQLRRNAHLVTEDLSLERGGRKLLKNVNVAFEPGMVTALVGPSGAGKTRLLRCLNRLDEPTHGRVLLNGVDHRTIDPRQLRRRLGMIFQVPAAFAGDVRANLRYGLDDPDDAELEPTTLAIMHGSSYTGDPSKALRALADDYEHCGRGPFRCTRTKVASSASRSC